MPHANTSHLGFQAFILCGPGISLETFTSDTVNFPKAIIPIANRPMVWYPLEWCYRMGVNDIYLISPEESKSALEASLARNPHLTSLPHPRPTILAPEGLTNASKTCQLFKFKEIRDVITSDFIVLPCDLVCELDGTALLQEWMVQQGGFGGATGGTDEDTGWPIELGPGGEKIGRRGGLSVWYETKVKDAVESEETDFMATAKVSDSSVSLRKQSIRKDISRLVLAMPTDSLTELIEEKNRLEVRHSLLRKFGQVKMRTTLRDAHIYFFPHWILELMAVEDFDTIGEDVLGWWSKATWQKGLGAKLGLGDVLDPAPKQSEDDMLSSMVTLMEKDIGVEAYRSSRSSGPPKPTASIASPLPVPASSKAPNSASNLVIPPILAYIHPSEPSAPIIRRIDSTHLLSSMSLKLALLPASETLAKGTKPSPFAHPLKIAHPAGLARHARVEADNCLLAENVTVGERCHIKGSVIGAGCTIAANVQLTKCVLMEGVIIGENVVLTSCVLGPRCKIEGGSPKEEGKTEMTNCEVQGGFVIPGRTHATDEKFMHTEFGGLEGSESAEEDDCKDPPDSEAPTPDSKAPPQATPDSIAPQATPGVEAFDDDGISHR